MIFSAIAFEGDGNVASEMQVESCMEKMWAYFGSEEMSEVSIVNFQFFCAEESGLLTEGESSKKLRKNIESQCRKHLSVQVPVSYVSQPPASGALFSLEVHYVEGTQGWQISTEEHLGLAYVLFRNEQDEKYLFANGITSGRPSDSIEASAEWAFEWMESVLGVHGMDFGHIFRQWNYIEDIVLEENEELHKQNYQVFNNVRSRFYSGSEFKNGYPAATGIGILSGGVNISFYASNVGSHMFKSVENPFQKAAFEYSDRVLVGDDEYEGFSKCSPKFARAKYAENGAGGQVFISGTASIRDEHTIGLGNISLQTTTTIENIAHLIGEADRLFRPKEESGKQAIKFYRVYIKKQRDYALVHQLCRAAWPKAHFNFVFSDVCRDELLVEIEAISA